MNNSTTQHVTPLFDSAKAGFEKAVDFLYGTQARTNRTLAFLVVAVLASQALDKLVSVPYCGV